MQGVLQVTAAFLLVQQQGDLSMAMVERFTSALHQKLVFGRRVRALASAIARVLPRDVRTVLDVGCGDGRLASLVMLERPDLRVTGLEVHARPATAIPVTEFDGRHIPFATGSYDAVMFVDVLHHADDADALLREAARVASRAVVIKDHLLGAPLSRLRLRAMDWVGNIGHGVALPYNYWTREQWRTGFARARLVELERREHLGLYPAPLGLVFEAGLHFVNLLAPVEPASDLG
jgi:SAM-dependent methyltransferase